MDLGLCASEASVPPESAAAFGKWARVLRAFLNGFKFSSHMGRTFAASSMPKISRHQLGCVCGASKRVGNIERGKHQQCGCCNTSTFHDQLLMHKTNAADCSGSVDAEACLHVTCIVCMEALRALKTCTFLPRRWQRCIVLAVLNKYWGSASCQIWFSDVHGLAAFKCSGENFYSLLGKDAISERPKPLDLSDIWSCRCGQQFQAPSQLTFSSAAFRGCAERAPSRFASAHRAGPPVQLCARIRSHQIRFATLHVLLEGASLQDSQGGEGV